MSSTLPGKFPNIIAIPQRIQAKAKKPPAAAKIFCNTVDHSSIKEISY